MLMMMTVIFSLLTLLLILLIMAIVVLPAIIAFNRRHRFKWIILALTVIGGWTGLVWIAALVWALMPNGSAEGGPSLKGKDKSGSWSPMVQEPEGALLASRRSVSGPLILGIVLLPFVFAWFTLRKGHSTISRIASIGYAVVFTLMGIYALTSWLTGLADRAVTNRANAEHAVANHLYLVTTVENVSAVLKNGQDEEYRRRILYMHGTITSMQPQSGHTEIGLQGAKGAEITLNGDYLVGLKPGDKATAACVSIMRIGPIKELVKCMVAPQGSLPLPGSADVKYDVTPNPGITAGPVVKQSTTEEDAGAGTDDQTKQDTFVRPSPDKVIPFGQPTGDAGSPKASKENPFGS